MMKKKFFFVLENPIVINGPLINVLIVLDQLFEKMKGEEKEKVERLSGKRHEVKFLCSMTQSLKMMICS